MPCAAAVPNGKPHEENSSCNFGVDINRTHFYGSVVFDRFFSTCFFFGSIFRYLGSRGEESLSAMELLKSEQWWEMG